MSERKPSLLAVTIAAVCLLLALLPAFSHAGDTAAATFTVAVDGQEPVVEGAGPHFAYHPRDPVFSYYTVAPDPRLCPSPLCGGYWVSSVNRPLTVCADGSQEPRCYVAELDLSLAGIGPAQEAMVRSAAGHLLLRGFLQAKPFQAFGNLGVFRGQEAWIGHPGIVAVGTFYRARSTGIVCFAFPCPTVKVALLDQERSAQQIAGVDLRAVGANPADGNAQLDAREGLVTAGDLVPVSGAAGQGVELESTEYYLPVRR